MKSGEMSERLKEPVLKTGDVKASVGSNPTLSATYSTAILSELRWFFCVSANLSVRR